MYIRTSAELGALIRDRRKSLGLDQRQLAERVGVSRQWIVGAEHGKRRAEIGLVLRTLEALGVQISVEIGRHDGRQAESSTPDIDAIIRNARKPKR